MERMPKASCHRVVLFTVTKALPVLSPALAVQLASVKVAIVYVVVDDGETDTLIVGAVPLKAILPGESVPLMVPLPVTAILKLVVVLCPLQYVTPPLMTPVGRALILTVV